MILTDCQFFLIFLLLWLCECLIWLVEFSSSFVCLFVCYCRCMSWEERRKIHTHTHTYTHSEPERTMKSQNKYHTLLQSIQYTHQYIDVQWKRCIQYARVRYIQRNTKGERKRRVKLASYTKTDNAHARTIYVWKVRVLMKYIDWNRMAANKQATEFKKKPQTDDRRKKRERMSQSQYLVCIHCYDVRLRTH